jgi:hypothetical protein
MAINERVGILTHVPGDSRVTPGLIEGLYVDYLTKELDFLDDLRVSPSIESMNSPYSGDLDTLYRQWRDERFVREVNYWNARKNREPFTYQNFVIDPSADGSNAFEWLRTVTPSPNGDFNVPYPNPVGSTQSFFYNSERPLKHLYLRVNLPVEDMGFSCAYASGCNYWLESTSQVRDNQAAIDVVQVSIDLINNAANIINDNQRLPNMFLIEPTHNDLQSLIDSGADQTLIDAKQAEYDAIIALENTYVAQMDEIYLGSLTNGVSLGDFQNQILDLENNSQWVSPNTMEKMNTDFRANRDAYLKAMNELALGTPLSEQYGMVLGVYKESLTEEDLAAMRQAYLDFDAAETNPNPWSDERFRFAWGDGQNPVEGAPNGTIHNMIGWGQGSNDLTNHPLGTMPFEVLPGVTSLNRLPAVSNISLLSATGSTGDIVMVDGEDFAWDPQNEEWSRGFYLRFLSPFTGHFQAMVDAKLKAVNENILATRPFLYASLYVPIGNVFSETGPKSPKTGVITIDTEPPTCPMDPIWPRDLYEAWKCALDPAFPNCDFSKY